MVDEYRARLATLGRRVRVEPVRGDPLLGTAVDVTDDGALVVRTTPALTTPSPPPTSSTSADRSLARCWQS